MKTFILAALFVSSLAQAKEITNIPEIGPHQAIFHVEKNVNPENIAVVYTKTDSQCRFVTDPANRDQPVFDFYWLMDGKDYKPMNSFFKSEFHKRMTFVAGATPTLFQLEANDLKEVKHDLGAHPRFDVVATRDSGSCDVQAFITLGPSDNNARIRLDSIFGEGRSFPPSVDAVTLKGEVITPDGRGTGKMISRRYSAN
ncbi:MAG: hypothetical protein ACXVB9_22375 [Bdellovibrionota bacterium]